MIRLSMSHEMFLAHARESAQALMCVHIFVLRLHVVWGPPSLPDYAVFFDIWQPIPCCWFGSWLGRRGCGVQGVCRHGISWISVRMAASGKCWVWLERIMPDGKAPLEEAISQ